MGHLLYLMFQCDGKFGGVGGPSKKYGHCERNLTSFVSCPLLLFSSESSDRGSSFSSALLVEWRWIMDVYKRESLWPLEPYNDQELRVARAKE